MAITSETSLPAACQRVAVAAVKLGISIDIRIMGKSSRTAEEAASACHTTLAQIVKSLVFCRKDNDQPVLLLVSGKNYVHESRTGRLIGSKLRRPDADYVRKVTGYSIGGIPPFAHQAELHVWIDEDLFEYTEVFAAAGTPNSIFSVAPSQLAKAVSATVICVT